MALILSGSINVSGSVAAQTILIQNGGGGIISSSQQIPELFRLMQSTASLNSYTGSAIGIHNGLMGYTASLKSAGIVSSSQQIKDYNTFITGNGLGGQIAYFSGSSVLTGSYGFYVDESQDYLRFDGSVTLRQSQPGITLTDEGNFILGRLVSDGTYMILRGNDLKFQINDSDKMVINSSGSVGINKTTPGASLDVNGTTFITGSVKIKGENTTSKMLQLTGTGTSDEGLYITTTGTGNNFYAIKVGTGTSAKSFVVTNAAKIGVGTDTPDSDIHISSSTSPYIRLGTSNSGGKTWGIGVDTSFSNGLNFSELGVADGRLFLQAGGNVGINKTTPGASLDVNGNTLITGSLKTTTDATIGGSLTSTGVITPTVGIYNGTGTISAAGPSDSVLLTLPNDSDNKVYIVTVRQQGAANNNLMGMAFAINSNVTATKLAYSSSLSMDIYGSGSDVRLVLGSGFGTTTWEYSYTRLT